LISLIIMIIMLIKISMIIKLITAARVTPSEGDG